MSHACTSILVGVAPTVLEIQKQPNFSFGPWSSENLIDRNRLKKIMLVGIDVTCMHNDFGGHSLSGFGDTVTFKNGKISP